MSKTTYFCTYTDSDCGFYVRADWAQASSQIEYCYYDPTDPDEWCGSQYQVADAQHDWNTAADLIEAGCDEPGDIEHLEEVDPETFESEAEKEDREEREANQDCG